LSLKTAQLKETPKTIDFFEIFQSDNISQKTFLAIINKKIKTFCMAPPLFYF